MSVDCDEIVSGESKGSPAVPEDAPLILIVDDLSLDRRVAGHIVEKKRWRSAYATNGKEAMRAIKELRPRLVLTDLKMPEFNGLLLVKAIRAQHPEIPVVLMTRLGSEEIALEALQAGAASYIPKKKLASDLAAVLEQALAASQTNGPSRTILRTLTRRENEFTLENDPTLIPLLVALLKEDLQAFHLCDVTDATRVAIALEEALLNALYHGNLELGSELRQKDEAAFQTLAKQRRQASPYCERRVHLMSRLIPTEAVYVISDEGRGFDAATALPHPTDVTGQGNTSGRGLLLMRTFMDEVTYSRGGTQVTLIKRTDRKQTS